MAGVTEARRRQLSLAGRLGALTLHTRHPDFRPDPTAATVAYQRSFEVAHGGHPDEYLDLPRRLRPPGLCRACPTRIEIPADWPPDRRSDAAATLRRIHFQRLADRAVEARRAAG